MKKIKLTQGKYALVDDENFEWLNQWKLYAQFTGSGFYAMRLKYKNGGRKVVMMHRLILGLKSSKIKCDHVDRNGLNNQKYNLRKANDSQNGSNKRKSKSSVSKYKGLSWYKRDSKWYVHCMKNGKAKFIGGFDSEIDAARAYNIAAIKAHKEFAYLNKI